MSMSSIVTHFHDFFFFFLKFNSIPNTHNYRKLRHNELFRKNRVKMSNLLIEIISKECSISEYLLQKERPYPKKLVSKSMSTYMQWKTKKIQ